MHNPNTGACQPCQPSGYSRLRLPRPLYLLMRLRHHLRTGGSAAAYRAILRFFRARRAPTAAAPRRLADEEEALGLAPGELVEVKSDAEIRRTLDAGGAHRGLRYLPGMRAYCGRRFRVQRRLERMFLEESQQVRTLKHTVLLAGVHCGGDGIGCDRQCFYFWREAWLRRVPPESIGEHRCL